MLAGFAGHKRAGSVYRALAKQLEADGAEVLDGVVITVSPTGLARVYDPRRVVAGILTPAFTWGLLGLIGSGGSWASLVLWAVIGAVGGGLYAYYYEHILNKDELARFGKQLAPDSSTVLVYTTGADPAKVAAAATGFRAAPVSVATIDADLSTTVLDSSNAAGGEAALTMLLLRYAGDHTAKKVYTQVSGDSSRSGPTVETELLFRADRRGRRHVASPSAGSRASGMSDVVSWGGFGLVLGTLVGFAGSESWFGAIERGLATGAVWAVLGACAGALFGLMAGRGVSARRLRAVGPLLAPDTSMVVAWSEGVPPDETVAAWSAPGSQCVLLHFCPVAPSAVLSV